MDMHQYLLYHEYHKVDASMLMANQIQQNHRILEQNLQKQKARNV